MAKVYTADTQDGSNELKQNTPVRLTDFFVTSSWSMHDQTVGKRETSRDDKMML